MRNGDSRCSTTIMVMAAPSTLNSKSQKSRTTGDNLQDPDESSFIERASHLQGYDEFGRPSVEHFDALEEVELHEPSEQIEEQNAQHDQRVDRQTRRQPPEPSVHVQFYESPNECSIF